jgi:hypothetical protein
MHPLVRDLYKRFLLAGTRYPQGLDFVRSKVKEGFMKNKDLMTEFEIKRTVGKGRYMVRELNATSAFHKYRHLRKRYSLKDVSET